ncbi:hypothetical protein PT974_10080 [Cladobotryum mycophilum]|uniref:Integral membrane protein n=1 Tax=Cladobotryum mycophilum TaxID=491253 RepID=A0ABR0S9D0_9HYPO
MASSHIDTASSGAPPEPLRLAHVPEREALPLSELPVTAVPSPSLDSVEQMAGMVAGTVDEKATSIETAVVEPHPSPTWTSSSASVVLPGPGSDSTPGSERVTLVRRKDGYVLQEKPKLEHNLFMAVGFMELANACDFAANVWNKEPVPLVATIFMAIGGTVAGTFSLFAFRDAQLAWRNVCFLRQQRRELHEERARLLKEAPEGSVVDLDVLLDVSYRELGTEVIGRWTLDVFMGVGAVLISIGTYMALGGRNKTVYLISNILSGYLGNAPVALFGLFNSFWAIYIWLKVQSHVNAAAEAMPGTRAAALVKRRSRNVQTYCTINGTATILGGVGSMITSTRWWGYVILIPVILSSIFCNFWWRWRVGYARHDLLGGGMHGMNVDELGTALEFAARAEISVREQATAPLNGLVSDATSLDHVLRFLEEHELLEPYCLRLANDAKLRAAICGDDSSDAVEMTLGAPSLLAVPESAHPAMITAAQDLIRETGSEHFKHRERYTAELLGSYLCIVSHPQTGQQDAQAETREKKRSTS